MAVDFETFRRWAEDRFDDVIVKGGEIRINSIFAEDSHHHLWCSPSGGKKKRQHGVYRCFKTDRKGTLVSLVMHVDKCDHEEALATLNSETSVRVLEQRLEEFFAKQDVLSPDYAPPVKNTLTLPPHSVLIAAAEPWWRRKAEEYMASRCLACDGLYVCTDGKYKGRIVIPYFDREGRLVYWNARHIGKSKLRYVGPPKEVGVGKEDVVFMDLWPPPGGTVHLCEGEFNAKSLTAAGYYGAACGGKTMSEKQAAILDDYKLVVCLDRDKPGWKGAATMSERINAFNTRFNGTKLKFVRPPVGYKDWNEMLVKLGPNVLWAYVNRSEKRLESDAPFGTGGDYFGYSDL